MAENGNGKRFGRRAALGFVVLLNEWLISNEIPLHSGHRCKHYDCGELSNPHDKGFEEYYHGSGVEYSIDTVDIIEAVKEVEK